MGLSEIKNEFKLMEKSEIIKVISEMYKNIPQVKDYLDVFFMGNINDLIQKYKSEIEKCIRPDSRLNTKEAEARKLIRTVRKMKIPELTIALELHYVKSCLEFIEDHGYWDEAYYSSIETMFYSAIKNINKNGLNNNYKSEISILAEKSRKYGLDFEF